MITHPRLKQSIERGRAAQAAIGEVEDLAVERNASRSQALAVLMRSGLAPRRTRQSTFVTTAVPPLTDGNPLGVPRSERATAGGLRNETGRTASDMSRRPTCLFRWTGPRAGVFFLIRRMLLASDLWS